MRRGSRSTVVAVLLTVAGLVLLLWGSGQGSSFVAEPQGTWGPPPIRLPELPDLVSGEQPGDEITDAEGAPEGAERVIDLVLLFYAAVVVAGVLLVLRALLRRDRRERDPVEEPDEELLALLDASGEEVRYRALTEGDPRNAVVACWVALEDAVDRSGLSTDPSETAAELTTRVLGRWQVDPAAIIDLSEAYREARFSRHPVTEEQRRAAVDALERIHADLRRRALAEQEAASAAADADAAGADR
ncbi:DUF4129 domain-containing protein [uncultured Ornithinimicrobium sp.]|uniref:DUF4129 domain-containing protein n=1 Tax=uncultured Ornithinimicrobium sp. TaxID=259307 RepID=UPI002595A8E1|nr:DUF4129 domain-containing protein [uncultured Ornithinimicrobium sp.]